MWTGVPQQQTRLYPGHTLAQSHRSCLDIRQLINMVEYLSIYTKDYLQFYHTHIPVSSFGTKKMQRKRLPLCMYMAAGGIKGLIYLEARACFSVHSGIHFFRGPVLTWVSQVIWIFILGPIQIFIRYSYTKYARYTLGRIVCMVLRSCLWCNGLDLVL